MTEKEKLALIYRVTSGYTFIDDYIIDTPSDKILNESFNIYYKTIKNNRFEEFIHKDHTQSILITNNLWHVSYNQDLEELGKSLDECKLQLFNSYGALSKEIQKIRRQIELIKNKRTELLNIKHMLDPHTLEGYADYITDLFIFSKIVLDSNYNPISLDEKKLGSLIYQYKLQCPTTEQFREVARTDPWRSFWDIDKPIFRVDGDSQKTLILFTKMYNNVYENPDKPPEEVISDDDMLDGWFIHMKNKIDKERIDNNKNKYEQRHKNAGEIFIMADSPKDIEEIDKMNSPKARIIKKRIMEGIKHKDMTDMDIPEFKAEVLSQRRNNGR